MATSTITSNSSGWGSVNSYLYYKKTSGMVTIYGQSSGGVTLSANAWNNIGTLPSGYRPSRELIGTAELRDTVQPTMIRVKADGTVSMYNETNSAQSYWVYNFTFPL